MLNGSHRLDDRKVRSEASMSACALNAEQDAVRGPAPAGFGLSTIHARAVRHVMGQATEILMLSERSSK